MAVEFSISDVAFKKFDVNTDAEGQIKVGAAKLIMCIRRDFRFNRRFGENKEDLDPSEDLDPHVTRLRNGHEYCLCTAGQLCTLCVHVYYCTVVHTPQTWGFFECTIRTASNGKQPVSTLQLLSRLTGDIWGEKPSLPSSGSSYSMSPLLARLVKLTGSAQCKKNLPFNFLFNFSLFMA